MGARYDPYMYVREQEEREAEYMASRPVCECCGEVVMEDPIEIGGILYCEDCVINAWSVIQKRGRDIVKEALKSHSDFPIIDDLMYEMIERFDFGEYVADKKEV